jgi:predicted ATPase
MGIHTGLVVVGAMGGAGRQEQLALGETPNIAARIQGLAMPDTVVMSEATSRLIQGYFALQPLGMQELQGLARPIAVYRALRESDAHSRLDVTHTRELTPLVGREQEVRLLLERWAQVKDGLGQVVLVSGEAGIGKSRLVQVMKEQIAAEPHIRLECRCSPYYQHTAFYPLIDLLERILRFQQDEAPEVKLEKLERNLSRYRLPLEDTMPLFATFLSLPLPEARYQPLALPPQRQKQKTLEALLAIALELAEKQPVFFIIEDLHWVDPSTLEFLTLLINQGPTAPFLTMLTCRPEFHSPWGLRTHLTPLALQRLPPAQVRELVERVTGGKALPPEVTHQVVSKTDGVPLFVEELTKMVVESGLLRETQDHYELTGPVPTMAIPTTLHDSLMARLDRLATVKVVAQLGATLGRTFAYDLLQAVAPLDEATLQHGLRQLVSAELLYQRGMPPQATYLFKHALIQDAAYQSLLKSTRQHYHQRIALVLAERFPDTAATQPELLAHHYTEAGLSAEALPYWQRAGQRALERSANAEAISHLTRGLEVLATLPDTPERAQEELTLQMDLGVAFTVTKGFAALEIEQTYARARALCQQMGDIPKLVPVLYSLWNFYLVRVALPTAFEIADQLSTLAESEPDPVFRMEAHNAQAQTRFMRGDFAVTRVHLEHGIALYDLQQHRSLALVYGEDPGIGCRVFAVWTLWCLGYPEQSLHYLHDLQTLAQELAHPFSWAQVWYFGSQGYLLRRDVPRVAEWAERLITLSREQDFALWVAGGMLLHGWALTAQGRWEEGLAQMQQGLTDWRATGAEIWRPYFLTLLAEAYATAGQIEAGLSAVDEALMVAHTMGEHWWDAESHRLKGEGLQRQVVPDEQQAEACFQQALDIARQQQARSLELRAAMSLGRLWQRQDKRTAARQLLAEVYDWFTEGFDTADLQDARALLEAWA